LMKEFLNNINWLLEELQKNNLQTKYTMELQYEIILMFKKITDITKTILLNNKEINWQKEIDLKLIENLSNNKAYKQEFSKEINLKDIFEKSNLIYIQDKMTTKERKELSSEPLKYKIVLENNYEEIEKLSQNDFLLYNLDIKQIFSHRSHLIFSNEELIKILITEIHEKKLDTKFIIEYYKNIPIEEIKSKKFQMKLLKSILKELPEQEGELLLQENPHISSYFERKQTIKSIKSMI